MIDTNAFCDIVNVCLEVSYSSVEIMHVSKIYMQYHVLLMM